MSRTRRVADDAEQRDDETEPPHDRRQHVATDDEQGEGTDEDRGAEHRRHRDVRAEDVEVADLPPPEGVRPDDRDDREAHGADRRHHRCEHRARERGDRQPW